MKHKLVCNSMPHRGFKFVKLQPKRRVDGVIIIFIIVNT